MWISKDNLIDAGYALVFSFFGVIAVISFAMISSHIAVNIIK